MAIETLLPALLVLVRRVVALATSSDLVCAVGVYVGRQRQRGTTPLPHRFPAENRRRPGFKAKAGVGLDAGESWAV